MLLKLSRGEKRMFWAVQDFFLALLQIFESETWTYFFGKLNKNFQNCLNQKFVIGSTLESGFEATSNWKTNVLSVWNQGFLFFANLLVTLIVLFGKASQNHLNYLNQQFAMGAIFENGFEVHCSEKRMFWKFENENFGYFARFWVTRFNVFLGRENQNCGNENFVLVTISQYCYEAALR